MDPIDRDQLLDFIKFDEKVIAPEKHTAKDIVMMIQTAPTIAPPPNDPLTLEQLLEMDGEPVWVVNSPAKRTDGFNDEWAIVSTRRNDAESVGTIYHFENYEDYWLAYRRKPEEGTA